MSRLRFNKVAVPAAPAANKGEVFMDTDSKRPRFVNDDGDIVNLTDDGMRGWNAVLNGGMDLAQRQAPGTLTTYSNTSGRAYGADRWGVTNENASAQYQRIDTSAAPETNLQSRFYGTWSKITSTGKLVVSQVIEGSDCMSLRGRKVRVQLKVKSSAGRTLRVVLLQLTNAGALDTIPATFISAFGANTVDPTWGTNLTAIAPVTPENATVRNTGLDVAATTNWQRVGAVFTLPSNLRNLVIVVFGDSQLAAADSLSMSEVGLYDGTEIRQWVPRAISSILSMCQRFYCKSFAVDTAPAQNAGLGGAVRGNVAVAAAVAAPDAAIRFPVNMRATPALTYYNPSAANAFLRNVTAGTDATATATGTANEAGTDVSATGLAAWTVAQSTAVHYSADAEL